MKKIFAAAAATMFVFVLSATATLLTYGSYPTGFNDGSFYVGEAAGNLGGQSIEMWCVDPLHQISTNFWDVDVINLASPVGLDGLLGLTVNDFRAMYLLGLQFTGTSQAADVSLQHEIWSFANPSGYTLSVAELAQKNSAIALVAGYNFASANVLVPQGDQGQWTGQIFETGAVNTIPEPATWILFLVGSGLLLVSWRCNRSKQS